MSCYKLEDLEVVVETVRNPHDTHEQAEFAELVLNTIQDLICHIKELTVKADRFDRYCKRIIEMEKRWGTYKNDRKSLNNHTLTG